MVRHAILLSALLQSAVLFGAGAAVAQQQKATADGQLVFNNACRTCHSTKPGDNRLGPSLHGVFGAKAGAQSGYSYSPSLKGAKITWDEKTLDAFIANPDAVVSGNNMKPYTGISSAEERAKIIAFLKSAGGTIE